MALRRLSRRAAATAVALAALAALAAPGAQAFDSGPHTDLTRDALTAEGFGTSAANVAAVDNWFVDYYWNAKENPFSGHAGMLLEALANANVVTIEHWPDKIIFGTNHLHFDSSEAGFPDLSSAQGIDEEWQRLMKITRRLLSQTKDPLTVLTILGISTHAVQDFYSHTNWVETAGEYGSPDGPGWSSRYGSAPTYFDIDKSVRESKAIYSAVHDVPRGHGKWQTNHNDSLQDGLNKDWPGRPLYEKAYLTAYFATRQWVRAARGWLGDEAVWARAKNLAAPARLKQDLRASLDVSKYAGHWQGNGQPCEYAIIVCGELKGWAGSVLGLRSAIKTYHEDVRISPSRLRFEDIVPSYYEKQPSGAAVPEPAPTREIQQQTRFVKLQVLRMRGYDWALGDPGPDDADLYASARMRGQEFDSPVIHDHDVFSFPKPYAPFTWIRSVPTDWRASTPVSTLTVRVRTGDRRYAGTDDDVYLRVNNGLRFSLEKRAYNDFERGDDDTYAVALDDVTRNGLSVKDIAYAQIEKSRDGVAGGWFLASFEVRLNGRVIASRTVNKWLEDDHRTYRAPVSQDLTTSDIVPVWLTLDEDDYLYGGDDDGDINAYDRNTTVAFGYVPGAAFPPREETGGDKLSGRLSMQNGEKGQVRIQMWTIPIVAPPLPEPLQPPPAEPGPQPTPTPTPVPTPTTQPTGKADLVITDFSWYSITIKNQGAAPSGPFSVTATNYPAMRSQGLAGGESVTFQSGNLCAEGLYQATADSGSEVNESNEDNNTAQAQTIC